MQQAGTRYCFRCGFVSTSGEDVCPEDGSKMTVAGVDPYIGKTLSGKYEVVELLGRGGMSVVYKVRQLFINRLEALKLMRSELVCDGDALLRFQQESKAVAALRHVNIVTVLDFGVLEDGNPFLTMEFLEGQDLGDVIEKEHHLTPERAIPIFAQICAGLHHAHSRGVIHRDIKPSNILITTANGVDLPIIVDFGIAKLLHADGSTVNKLTTTGQVFGSPLYMSPEQCNSKRVDERTDVYALGCVFYHALTGEPPIKGNAPLETMMRQMTETAPPFSVFKPDHTISPEIENVVLKALAKNPDDRFANMNELRQALLKAANMTITDLNSGSYIQSSGITPGIGTASGISYNRAAEPQSSGARRPVPQSGSSSQAPNRQSNSSNHTSARKTDSQQFGSAQPSGLFRSSESTGERYVVEPSYQGLLRRPVVLISVSLVTILFMVVIAGFAISPGKQRPLNGNDSIEQTFEGESNAGRKPGERPGYADNSMAKGDEPNPNLIATNVLPASPVPGSPAAFSSQPALTESRAATRSRSASFGDVAKSKNKTTAGAAGLMFNRGRLTGSWQYEDNLVDALAKATPGEPGCDGIVYTIPFSGSGSDDFFTLAKDATDKLVKNNIAVSGVTPLRRINTSQLLYQQDISYTSKDPQNPHDERRSFVLFFNNGDRLVALHVVPGRKGNQATREFIEKVIIPKFSASR